MIEVSHLTKQFNGKGGFIDISLSIKEGEVFSFLGKNGAGKSTFIKTLLGLLKPTDGKAEILGKPIGNVEIRKKIGYLPELFQYHTWLTGYELLNFHGKLYKMSPSEIKKRIPEVLQIIGLTGHENKKIKEYSKGMQQRIGLGCAIISDPEILFLDEPTSALDPVGRKQVRTIIFNLKKQGKTIFLNTHLLSEVELVSDRIAILDKGKIQKIGTIRDLLHSPFIITVDNINEEIVEALRAFDPKLKKLTEGFEMSIENEVIPDVVEKIIQNKGRLYELKRKENALESLFIDIVGEEDIR
jgi:ABC-2 type transport system ATP-binding protein